MTIIKSIASVFILLLFSIIIGLSIQAQQQTNRNNTRQVGNMLQQLERSSSRFRNSLNVALVQGSLDQTQPQNDISTFQPGLELAIRQFRDQFTRRLVVASDVESIMVKASPINNFITQNTLTPPSWGNSQTSQTRSSNREFIVRDGETLVVVLNNDLTTKQTKQGDRFTMTVRHPSQYKGAIIAGAVGSVDQGGCMSGRSELSLNFDTIRLRNGQTYRFAGILENVRRLDGAIKVDGTELTIRSSGPR